jgi:hypothetical protein
MYVRNARYSYLVVIDIYRQRMLELCSNLGGDPNASPPSGCADTQGWWWHEVYLILGGDPDVSPPEGCKDVFGFWLQRIYEEFGGDKNAWPPSDFEDPWGWWLQKICAVLGNDPGDWQPSDETDPLNWWLLKLINLSADAAAAKVPLRFYQAGGDLYINITGMGESLNVNEDSFEINADGELVSDTPIDNSLNREETYIKWNG